MQTHRKRPGRVVAIVLAAGRGERFGGGKLLAPFRGAPLVSHAIRVARAAIRTARADDVVAVVPADDEMLQEAVRDAGAAVALNPDRARGLSHSLRVGLDAIAEAEAAIVMLGDQPMVALETVAALLAAHRESPEAVIRPVYEPEGAPGHPVIVPRRWWPRLTGSEGDRGFAAVLGPEVPILTVTIQGRNPDVDTRAELAALEADPQGAS